MTKPKFFITTTVPMTLPFFSGQCKELNQTFDVCAVSSPGKELQPFAEQEGIRYKALRMEREISLLSDLISLFKWICLLMGERPRVVHANTPKASLLAMVAARLTCRPVRIYMCHGLRYQGCGGTKRKLLMWMERISCFCATRVVCVSQGVREQLAADGICPARKSTVILSGSANGVDTDHFNPAAVDETPVRERYGITDADWTFVFIGRMVRDKGVEELVEAATALHKEGKPVKLLMVGGRENKLDALSPRTEQLIAHSPFVIECGRQADVRPFIKAAKALVLPSYREGFGQVLVEANSLGVPVIATNIVGCKNAVAEGINGTLCEPRDSRSLHEAMARLMGNEELYRSIKAACREYTIRHFDRKTVGKAYTDFYRSYK